MIYQEVQMKIFSVVIVLALAFVLSACELKDTGKGKCRDDLKDKAIVSITGCSAEYLPGTAGYKLCVNLILITFIDDLALCND
jgi:hypothetical protein